MTPPSTQSTPRRQPLTVDLKVSAYDRVASWLMALILFVGFLVALMFLYWLFTTLQFSSAAVPVMLVEELAGRGAAAEGYERDLEPPGLEEVEEIIEPQIEETLEAVTTELSTVAASFEPLATSAVETAHGRGRGDERQAGPGGEGEDIIPRWERWEIHYASDNIQEYARQLDFFNIELGAAGGGQAHVDYVSNLSNQPEHRTGSGDQERRMYMTWSSGAMQAFDRQLLGRAGVSTRRRVLLQFYPPQTENLLAQIEMEFARSNGVDHPRYIQKTIFTVNRADGGGYEFRVVDQQYRQPTT